jgi:hypothetical protein
MIKSSLRNIERFGDITEGGGPIPFLMEKIDGRINYLLQPDTPIKASKFF